MENVKENGCVETGYIQVAQQEREEDTSSQMDRRVER